MRRVLSVVAAAPLFLLGCGSDVRSEPPVAVASTSSPVINGTLDTGTDHDTVVYISFLIDEKTGLGGACTGTLIAPNVIATARHCVSNLDESVYPPRVKADFVPSNMYVYLGTNPTGTGFSHKPNGIGLRIVHDGATTLENSDFALLVTTANISPNYA
ncbi:MAG: trypsin-like serine protease, partial [Polyangiales bacterium]